MLQPPSGDDPLPDEEPVLDDPDDAEDRRGWRVTDRCEILPVARGDRADRSDPPIDGDSMLTPCVVWNHLVPWRRRRRYYFLKIVGKLRELQRDPAHPSAPIDLRATRLVFDVEPTVFDALLAGAVNPPRYVEQLAIDAYKVPAPPFRYVYGPSLSAIMVLVMIIVLLVRG